MDAPKQKLGWLEWCLIIVLVVVLVIAAVVLLGPQGKNTFIDGPDALWLHLVGR